MAAEIEPLAYVLHLAPDDRPEILMWTFGGMLGYHGVNSRGAAHFANSLAGGPAWKFGLPHYPLKRLFLECGRTTEILELMGRHPVCSSGNYVLCGGDGAIADVELTPDGPHVLPPDGSGFLVHSNHFLCALHSCAANLAQSLPDSVPRLLRMQSLVQSRFGSLTIEEMKTFLSDHEGYPVGICRHPHDGPENDVLPRTGKTVAALIAEPDSGRLHVARGNPCENEFAAYSLSRAQ